MFPLADHGELIMAVPFVVPMVLVVLFLAGMVIRDRLQRRA
jgi:hypothetical protein